jgi:hypothetical protein
MASILPTRRSISSSLTPTIWRSPSSIHQSEHDGYDETVQMSFSLALDQVRFAIAARRAVLIGDGGGEARPSAQAAAA